jgi:prolyl 4-hydroxylase
VKLVMARGAPYRPRDGVGLLADAVRAGGGEASAFLSVLAGLGLHLPQNWVAALDHLKRAAALGWGPAQAQLRILARGDTGDSVDLGFWTSAPQARGLSASPRILELTAAAPVEACDFLVAQSKDRLVRAEVQDPETGLTVMGKTRTNRVANFGLHETSLLNLLIQARIGAAAGIPLRRMEAFAILNYQPGEEASDHFDFLDPAVPAYAGQIARFGQRVATALLYLNDDYEGGVTAFPELGIDHRGAKGDALLFFSVDDAGRPDRRTVHAGRPPTSGQKWVLSQFIRDRSMVEAG